MDHLNILMTFRYALEILLMQYNVDMIFWGHTHNYERFLPFYDYEIYNGTADDPYMNPGAPVHIISGSAVYIIIILYIISCNVFIILGE